MENQNLQVINILHILSLLDLNVSHLIGRKTPTPNKNGNKTPSGTSGDRFIPNRGASNFELGHYLVSYE